MTEADCKLAEKEFFVDVNRWSYDEHQGERSEFTGLQEGCYYDYKNGGLFYKRSLTVGGGMLRKHPISEPKRMLAENPTVVKVCMRLKESAELGRANKEGKQDEGYWLNKPKAHFKFLQDYRLLSAIESKFVELTGWWPFREDVDDRQFAIHTREIIDKTKFPIISQSSATLDFLRSGKLVCPRDHAITGLESWYDANREDDRKFKIFCGRFENTVMRSCVWGSWTAEKALFNLQCGGDKVLSGIDMIHNAELEDRKFRINCCALGKLPMCAFAPSTKSRLGHFVRFVKRNEGEEHVIA